MKKQASIINDDYQLNSSVAMKVMGFRQLFYPGVKKQIPYYLPKGATWKSEVLEAKPLPKYSSEIKPAWSVLEKLVAFGWNVHIENSSSAQENSNTETIWCVTVAGKGTISTVCSENLPEAICRTALEAIEKRSDSNTL